MEVNEDGTIAVYGSSGDYGKADEDRVLKILKKDFPDKNFYRS